MAPSCQSNIGAYTSRSLKARRIVDRRLEAECGDRADTRHGHEPADLHITTRQLVNLAVEIFDLLLNGLACLEQRPDRSHQLGTIFDQPLGAHGEDIELGAADDETEVLKQATDLVLEIALDLDQQRPARQRCLDPWLSRSMTRTSLNQPVCMMRAMPAASLRSLLLICILSTALAWRASMQITGRSSRLSSVHSRVVVGPVSMPIRTVPGALDLTNEAIASDQSRPRPLERSVRSGSPRRSMSASTTRPVQHNIPLPLSIVARPHEAGLIRSWRADSLCLCLARSRNYPMSKSLRTSANSDSGDSMDWVMEAGMISSLFGSIDPSRK